MKIDEKQLKSLISLGYSRKKMSEILGIPMDNLNKELSSKGLSDVQRRSYIDYCLIEEVIQKKPSISVEQIAQQLGLTLEYVRNFTNVIRLKKKDMKTTGITTEVKEVIINLRKKGETYASISKKVKLPLSTVAKIWYQYLDSLPKSPEVPKTPLLRKRSFTLKRPPYLDEDAQFIIEQRKKGVLMSVIAKKLGRSPQAIYSFLKRIELKSQNLNRPLMSTDSKTASQLPSPVQKHSHDTSSEEKISILDLFKEALSSNSNTIFIIK